MKKQLLIATGAVFMALAGIVGYSALSNPANAGDCSTNSVITCGITSISQLRDKYNKDQPAGTQTIYNYFGVNSNVVNHAAYQSGYVTKTGNVVVDGKVVATGAVTAGREYMPGSTKHIVNGTTFYTRTPSVSFMQDQLAAIVFFDAQGRFIGASILDCGNPVTGHNEVTPPVYSCDSLTAAKITRETYDFTVKYTAKNGATFQSFDLDFGDGQVKTGYKTSPVRHTYAKAGTYKIVATVHFSGDRRVWTDTCTATVTVDQAPVPGVEIQKTVNNTEHQTVQVNVPFTYELIVKNTGNVDLTYVSVSDRAPHGVTFISADKGSVAGNVFTYTIPSLKIGASVKIVITAKVTQPLGNDVVVTNQACVDAHEVNGNPDDCDTATINTHETPPNPVPAVDIQKTVNNTEHQTVKLNTPFTYELVVKNTGKVDLTNLKVTDTAPEGVVFIKADKGTVTGNSFSYTVPSLKIGESIKIVITAKLTKYVAGNIVNKACVDMPQTNGNPDDCDTAEIDTPKPEQPHMIKVCDTTTDTIVTIDEKDFKNPPYTKDLTQCDKVKVCDTSTDTIIEVAKNDMKPTYTTDLSQCDKVTVCDTTTGQIVTVPKNEQTDTQTTNMDACTDIKVCKLDDKTIVTIKKNQLNNNYTTDLDKCAEPEQPETPAELPHTGVMDILGGGLGVGSLVGAAVAYTNSRRSLRQ